MANPNNERVLTFCSQNGFTDFVDQCHLVRDD